MNGRSNSYGHHLCDSGIFEDSGIWKTNKNDWEA